jgi:hypothetical protein
VAEKEKPALDTVYPKGVIVLMLPVFAQIFTSNYKTNVSA